MVPSGAGHATRLHEWFEVVTEFETNEDYGFSVKKGGNDDLLTAINDAIASDEYDAVYEAWFGTAPAE